MVSWEEQQLPRSFDSVFYGAAGGGVDLPSDDEFNNVSFLSHFEGSNNGVNNVFDDGSTSNHTITANGNVSQGSFGPFAREAGYWGIDFINSTGARNGLKLCEGYQTELVMTGTFTIEFWLFHRYVNGYQTFFGSGGGFSGWNSSTGHELTCFCGSNSAMFFQFWNGSSYVSTDSTAVGLNEGEWNHVAIVNNGGNWTTYLNGTGNTTTSYGNVAAVSSTGSWASYIGCANGSNDNNPCKGIMSNVRFVKGTAVYTSNFTPSTAPLTAITNTSSLVAQNNRFVDNSSHANTVTPTGAIQITAFGPFLTSSVYDPAVNGASSSPLNTANYLSIADGSWKTLGTGDFTWEFWFYGKAESTYMLGDATSSSNVSGTFTLGVSGKRIILYYSIQGGEAYPLQSPNSAPFYNLNEWHHLAYVRDGNDHKIYADGILRASETRSGTMVDSTGAQHIGNFGAGYSSGEDTILSDVRLVKGTAVYSGSTYTVPTAPLSAITNTQLLLNMADGQAIDSTAQRNLSLENGTNISTAQAKFGNSSLYFDGTTDTATVIGSENVDFGTANFTVEGWIRPASFSGYKPNIISKWTNGSRGWAVRLVASGSGFKMRFTFSTNGSNDSSLDATTVLAFDTWHHFAFVQNSNTVTCYANGTANGTISCSTIFVSTNPIILGDWDSNAADYNGYIDDIRVTTGFARYTSNFTVPDAAFPDRGQEE